MGRGLFLPRSAGRASVVSRLHGGLRAALHRRRMAAAPDPHPCRAVRSHRVAYRLLDSGQQPEQYLPRFADDEPRAAPAIDRRGHRHGAAAPPFAAIAALARTRQRAALHESVRHRCGLCQQCPYQAEQKRRALAARQPLLRQERAESVGAEYYDNPARPQSSPASVRGQNGCWPIPYRRG